MLSKLFDKKKSNVDLLKEHLKILKSLQYPSGLFAASSKSVSTGYDKSWLRDNFYECLAFQVLGDKKTIYKTYRALLNIFKKHEYKIRHAAHHKPEHRHQYIHARFHPETFNEFWEEWGNKQNDSIGAILFGIGKIEQENPDSLLIFKKDKEIIQLLVDYLESLEYWHDKDSGVWEEDEEIHASSVGACVAGLKAISQLDGIKVNPELIHKGEEMLNSLLPRESQKKFVDLALLSLIYPYNIVSKEQEEEILTNVEYHLLRKRGVIRYKNDYYYNKNDDGKSEEAEWVFGLAWLSIIHSKRGEKRKSLHFLHEIKQLNTKYGMPELYFSNSRKYNENTPLGWTEAMFIIALEEVIKKQKK